MFCTSNSILDKLHIVMESDIFALITPPARRAWRSYKFAAFCFFLGVEGWATAHG